MQWSLITQSGPGIGDTDQWGVSTRVMTINDPRQICPHSALLPRHLRHRGKPSLRHDDTLFIFTRLCVDCLVLKRQTSSLVFRIRRGERANYQSSVLTTSDPSMINVNTDRTISSELIELVSAVKPELVEIQCTFHPDTM